MSSPVPSPRQPKKVLRLGPLYRTGGAATPEAERLTNSINQIIRQTRTPFGELRKLDNAEVAELETALRELETRLGQHEQANQVLQGQLAERERDLWETEALLKAREEVLQAERRRAPALAKAASATAGPSTEEVKAHEKLKAELDAQEATLKEAKSQLRDREQFLEEAENQLMEKMAAQQEKEVELEQREEDLRNRERKFRHEAGLPPLPEKPEPREQA